MSFKYLLGAGAFACLVLCAQPSAHAQISGIGSGSFTTNGSAAISGATLTLTSNGGSQAGSAFFNTPQTISAFTSQFIYTPSGDRSGDGVAFVLQNDPTGASALGAGGGFLGYTGITPSAAVELNIYSPNGIGTNYKTNGGVFGYNSTSPVNIAGGDPIQVTLNYDGATLTETLLDTTTLATFTTTYTTNIAGVVGASTAFVGFTGGTGAALATQTISGFTFRSTPASPVPEPGSVALLVGMAATGAGFVARRKRGGSNA